VSRQTPHPASVLQDSHFWVRFSWRSATISPSRIFANERCTKTIVFSDENECGPDGHKKDHLWISFRPSALKTEAGRNISPELVFTV
jgi:hypothetical protein